jgi:hypothetical protein
MPAKQTVHWQIRQRKHSSSQSRILGIAAHEQSRTVKKTAVRSMLPTAVRRIVLKPSSYGVGLGFTEAALLRPNWEFCTPFVRVAEFPCFKPKAELPWPALCVAPVVFRGPATARDAMVKPDIAISAIFPFMFLFMFSLSLLCLNLSMHHLSKGTRSNRGGLNR